MVLRYLHAILAAMLICSDIAYATDLNSTSARLALSPTSRFNPIVTLEWYDGRYVIADSKVSFTDDTAFVYVNFLISQFLQRLSGLGKLGVSREAQQATLEKEKKEHLRLFIKCINDRFPATQENLSRFHFNEMSWEGNAVILPYARKNPGPGQADTSLLCYYLPGQRPTFLAEEDKKIGAKTAQETLVYAADGVPVVLEVSQRTAKPARQAADPDMCQGTDHEKQAADDFWDELILKADEAKRSGETLILGLDTSWIQNQAAVQPIISRMNQLPEDLRRLGLGNLVFRYGNGNELAIQLAGDKERTKAKFSNIIVIGNRGIITEGMENEFARLKSNAPEDRALLIGVNTGNLGYLSGVRILEMWLLALKLHSGIDLSQVKTDYINIEAVADREGKQAAFIFTPVQPYDISESARINRLQIDEINTKA